MSIDWLIIWVNATESWLKFTSLFSDIELKTFNSSIVNAVIGVLYLKLIQDNYYYEIHFQIIYLSSIWCLIVSSDFIIFIQLSYLGLIM